MDPILNPTMNSPCWLRIYSRLGKEKSPRSATKIKRRTENLCRILFTISFSVFPYKIIFVQFPPYDRRVDQECDKYGAVQAPCLPFPETSCPISCHKMQVW